MHPLLDKLSFIHISIYLCLPSIGRGFRVHHLSHQRNSICYHNLLIFDGNSRTLMFNVINKFRTCLRIIIKHTCETNTTTSSLLRLVAAHSKGWLKTAFCLFSHFCKILMQNVFSKHAYIIF